MGAGPLLQQGRRRSIRGTGRLFTVDIDEQRACGIVGRTALPRIAPCAATGLSPPPPLESSL
jgi:hypothetical protein